VRWPCGESNRGSCDTRAVAVSPCGKKLRLTVASNNRLLSSPRKETIVGCSVCSFVMHARPHAQYRWCSVRPDGKRRASVCSQRLYECAHPEDGASSLLRSVNNYQSTQCHVQAEGVFSLIWKTERCSCSNRHDVCLSV
jgi:hypothetical protein